MLERLSFFASLYGVHTNPKQGMWLLYVTVLILSAIVYRLGFAKKLPLYQRFRARLIVELYFQEDQYETHPAALKALAIGRLQQYPESKK